MNCTKCNSVIEKNHKFCTRCGQKMVFSDDISNQKESKKSFMNSVKSLSTENLKNVSELVNKENIESLKNSSLDSIKKQTLKVKDVTTDVISKYTNDLKIIIPIINKMGYEVSEIEVQVGIIPVVIPHFNRHTNVSIQTQEKIIEFCKTKNIPTLILSAILEASKLQSKMKFSSLEFREIEIELTVPPSVKIKFQKQK